MFVFMVTAREVAKKVYEKLKMCQIAARFDHFLLLDVQIKARKLSFVIPKFDKS